ncbi:clostri-philic family protein [Clostridium beijerinckii]|uniref:DUF5681 domain-containing protein n=1 Tax=Clostridium beijerinckii TaxID=1520 RepID=A0AAX0B264_CLOBE|nr:clostri-philic family protein [Clostridium beijerinckii]NRT89380.1 hypothetical protein [Clostridium beijerinckii]NYC74836.1 hypothetical protein [Clostridium beijerinckii]
MPRKDGPHKPGSSNPMQKGVRRRRLHANQDNVGDSKNRPEYENFDGEPIE